MFSQINIELTNRCNKKCLICNRWKDKHIENDIDFILLRKILYQLDPLTLVQFHLNGEPMLYERIKDVSLLCGPLGLISQFDTNGILLLDRKEDIKYIDIITVSVIENDPMGKEQIKTINQYYKDKPDTQKLQLRLNGDIDEERIKLLKRIDYKLFDTASIRQLHSSTCRNDYKKKTIIPEHGICQDLLSHPVIDSFGFMSVCPQYNFQKLGVIGDVKKESIRNIWEGQKRRDIIDNHISNKRNKIKFCKNCNYWGLPNG